MGALMMVHMKKEPGLAEALDLEKLGPKLPKRPRVLEIHVRPYVDSLGENELLVQVVLDNDTTEEEIRSESMDRIREVIADALVHDERFPYVRFATKAELEDDGE
jgi:hypothetical protein